MTGMVHGKDTSAIDSIIIGRVEPYIYAFSTGTVPNYLKVGDTARGVQVRLDEWRRIFPDLEQQYQETAKVDEDTFFRDFEVHKFLENEKGRHRLERGKIDDIPYYSREFFEGATPEDVHEAIVDIHKSVEERVDKYKFYTLDCLPQTYTYSRDESYPPRDNQQRVIDNFKTAVSAGRTNLLLYAVMRFGKSFTAMCCAKEIGAKIVAVVSAKADVREEWKKTVESHIFFADYRYIDSDALKANPNVVSETLADGKKVAMFLTLQDLQGDEIKVKHKEVFEREIDLLIIDETHFGARAESYGKALRSQRLNKNEIKRELKDIDGFDTLDKAEGVTKALNARVRLHLSGTPYRILMGDEFQKEDIVAFVQFTDIIDAQRQWNDEHLQDDDCEEWDNPYFGFPQMVRFAFNPNDSARRKMEQLRKEGITYAFTELFRPKAMAQMPDGSHRQFVHEAEILDLLQAIDGSKDDKNILGFLDYDRIKDGKMCRHIVCVLPYRVSCDAMAALIKQNRDVFKNLNEYEIINIAGFDDIKKYKSVGDVKRAISAFENENKKTLTLTVNRMLTGTTVPQWDTMLYLKGTASPQEYDQAIFRLQNQYVTTYKEGDKILKYNMKPQTLLVDFDPNRMFVLQEMRSQFYNVNTEIKGNTELKDRIEKELAVSPIIVVNEDKLQEATPANITDAVRQYSASRSILDDASDIPVDMMLLDDDTILKMISGISPLGSKNGLQIKPVDGDGDDLEIPEPNEDQETQHKNEDISDAQTVGKDQSDNTEEGDGDKLEKRLAAYYARVFFFAFLTESRVKSLDDVINQIHASSDNKRIAMHLGLSVKVLKLMRDKINPFILNKLDYKIENTNDLARDDKLKPIERVEIALRKFGRLSDSEVVTPTCIADKIVAMLPDSAPDDKYLDIASKQGEFAIALYKCFGDEIKNRVYAIPTSGLTYEFTRKTYSLLGMPVDHIFDNLTSYDLIGKQRESNLNRLKDMKFTNIIGNPPYQINDGGGTGSSSKPIYNEFVDFSRDLGPEHLCMIMPSRWMTGGKGLGKFRESMIKDKRIRELHDYLAGHEVFPAVAIEGGICYFRWDKDYAGRCKFVSHQDNVETTSTRYLAVGNSDVVIRDERAISILKCVEPALVAGKFSNLVSVRNPFKIYDLNVIDHPKKTHIYKILGRFDGKRSIKYTNMVAMSDAGKKLLKAWKVFISKADGAAGQLGNPTPARIIGKSELGEPDMVCTETFLAVGPFKSDSEAKNVQKYMATKFFRFLVGIRKLKNMTQDTYSFVPLEDFTTNKFTVSAPPSITHSIDWSKTITEIDNQLFEAYHLSDIDRQYIDSMIMPLP